MMYDNPYSALISIFRRDADERAGSPSMVGTVLSVSPLRVSMSGITLETAQLFRNPEIPNLEKGNTVLLIPLENRQRFLIVCKVVNA